MKRSGQVYFDDILAGTITQDEHGYHFIYNSDYLNQPTARPISLTLPLRPEVYSSRTMLPFFDGLIPEGWILDIAVDVWKLNPRDRMSLLLSTCADSIGAVSVIAAAEEQGD